MNSLLKFAAGLLLLVAGAMLGGCSIQSQRDSTIPWNRPADWEGQIPGMDSNANH